MNKIIRSGVPALVSGIVLTLAGVPAMAQEADPVAISPASAESAQPAAQDAVPADQPAAPVTPADDAAAPATADSAQPADVAAQPGAAQPTTEAAETVPVAPVAAKADEKAESEETPTEPGVQRIDAIMVTAQKQEERLQDVPVAITVIKQEELERANVTQITDLARVAPSIEFNGEPGNSDTRISIRGISTQSFSVTAEQAVSLVVDGVVLGKAPAVSLFDINRVEVLRGPQGTLFGKNSSAGAVSVTTNAPDPSRFSMGGRADLGNAFGYRLVQGSINIPVTDDSALRINVGQTYTKGFLHNNVRNEDSKQEIDGGRVRFMWQPLSDLTFNLIADFEKQYTSEQIYLQFSQIEYDNSLPNMGKQPNEIPGCNGAFASQKNRITCGNDPTYNRSNSWGFSGQVEWGIGDYTLTSISAFRRYTQFNQIDVDGLPGNYYNNDNNFNNRTITQELRIASPVDRDLKYVAGLFYSDTHVPNFLNQVIGADILAAAVTEAVPGLPLELCSQLGICLGSIAGLNQPNEYTADIGSYAAFGQVTYRLFDPLRLIAGARYTHDDVKMVSTNFIGVASKVPFLNNLGPLIPLNSPLAGASKVSNVSWRAGLQYDLGKDAMVFFTASKGYKGPQVVFNPPNIIPSINPLHLPTKASISIVGPEYPLDFELGLKTTILEGLVGANINLFHTTIKDFQSSFFNGQASFTPTNIPSVTTQGVEVDFFGYLAPGLVVNSGLLYDLVQYPHPYFAACTQVGPKCPDTKEGTVEDVGGNQLPIAPKFKITLSPEYTYDLPWALKAFVSTDIVFRTGINFQVSDDTRTEIGNRTVIGARIGMRSSDDNWEVSLFGRNLTNAYNPAYLFAPYLLAPATIPGSTSTGQALSTESFRFFGMSLGARF